ncbi:MAG: hypothetical protein FLDDKLPJ_02310 [Phycisphaerae bacterium]|nr:hypothetical protein [Phycisphaerae bacterium]
MRSNEDPRERAVVWQRNDDAQAGCIRECIEVAWPQPLDAGLMQSLRDTSGIRKRIQLVGADEAAVGVVVLCVEQLQ